MSTETTDNADSGTKSGGGTVSNIETAKRKKRKNPPRDGKRSRKQPYSRPDTKRAQRLRQEGRDALRDKIKASNHHSQLAKCAAMFADIIREVRQRPDRKVTPEYARKTELRMKALREKTRIHMTLLNKYLPDARNETGTEEQAGSTAQQIGAAFAAALNEDVA